MAKRFEESAQDRKGDAAIAAKAGLTADQFEGSSMDADHDASGNAGDNRARNRAIAGDGRASEPAERGGRAIPDHTFAHGRPRAD